MSQRDPQSHSDLPFPWLPASDPDNKPGGVAYLPTPAEIEQAKRRIRAAQQQPRNRGPEQTPVHVPVRKRSFS